jgi:S-DNA-T family DNA segregation ATPase FtsK/SpoIIIE
MIYKSFHRKKNFFSEDIRSFGQRRLSDIFYFCQVLLGTSFFLSMWSYNPRAASWNFLTTQPEKHTNLMGSMGAFISDLCWQFIGPTAYVFPVLLCVWGGYGLANQPLSHMKWRYMALLPIVLFLSAGLSGASLLWGGVVGLVIQKGIFAPLYNEGVPRWMISTIFFLAGMGGFLCILGVPWSVWRYVGLKFYKALVFMGTYASAALQNLKSRRVQMSSVSVEVPETNFSEDVNPLMEDDTPISASKATMPPPVQKTVSSRKVVSTSKETTMPTSRAGYTFPDLDLLQREPDTNHPHLSKEVLQENADKLKSILEDFGVQGEISNVYPGPVVTLYEFRPAPGVKSSRVIGLADDIARSTSSVSTRISVMPGVNALGIEIPNPQKETVYMRTLLEESQFQNPTHKLPLALGKNISGDPVIGDLGRMPHLLIAGTTGSGKSVSINTMILSLLYRLTPEECKFIMIDPKMLELSIYDGIPHLLTPVVTDPHKAVMALKWTVKEMESRYQAMSRLAVRNIEGYNKKVADAQEKGERITNRVRTGFDPETGEAIYEEQTMDLKPLPFIVVIVDEMADLMLVAGKDIEAAVQRLAQMARAAGIHLIMATQRPSVDVITGTIKANFPTRISFHVTSKIDSRTILGEQGAEQLLGQGDMLYMKPGGRVLRVHGPFVSDKEVESIVKHLHTQGTPTFEDGIEEEDGTADFSVGGESSGDALYDQALAIVLREQKASTSFIQRHLQIGYNRAARIIEKMEAEGVVSKPNHVGKREILINTSS